MTTSLDSKLTMMSLGYEKYEWSHQWIFNGLLFIILGGICLVGSTLVEMHEWLYHGIFCLTGLLITGRILVKLRKATLIVFISDLRIICLVVFAFYFLVGAAQISFDSEEAIAKVMAEWPLSVQSVLKIDAINAIGIGLTLIIASMIRPRWLPTAVSKVGNSLPRLGYSRTILIFIVFGGFAYVKVLLNDYSANPTVISGLWRNASLLLLSVILLAMIYNGKRAALVQVVITLIAVSLSVAGFLGYSKSAFVTPLLLLFLGLGIRKNSLKICIGAVIFALIAIDFVGGAIGYARVNSIPGASLDQRWEILVRGFEQDRTNIAADDYSVWGRLNYIPAQAAAVDFYDQNIGGDDFKMIFWTIVPRFIYPEKPVMTSTGTEFYYKITGQYGSSTGMGLFANGYYNLGWIGLLITASIFGFMLAQVCAVSRLVVEKSYIILFPLVFLCFNMSAGSSGILVELIGQFVIMVATILSLLAFSVLLNLRNSPARYVWHSR